jgi:hypothetical protein
VDSASSTTPSWSSVRADRRHRRDRRRQDHGGAGAGPAVRRAADAGRVRPARPRPGRGPPAAAADAPAVLRAVEAGAELDDGALLVSRSGRRRRPPPAPTRSARSVPVGVLGELAERVLAVHGQSDQQRLLRPCRAARGARPVRRRAGARAARAVPRAVAPAGRRSRPLLALRAAAAERTREAELLRLGLAEVEAARPCRGRASRSPPRSSGSPTPTTCGPLRLRPSAPSPVTSPRSTTSTRSSWSRRLAGPWSPVATTTRS